MKNEYFACVNLWSSYILDVFTRIRWRYDMTTESKKSKRGFASMDPEKRREIARKGGLSVPNEKRIFSLNPELAASAGRTGGKNVKPANRSFARDPELAAAAGRKGGRVSPRADRAKQIDAAE